MKHIFYLINKHRLISTHLILLVVSYLSFQYYLERLLTPYLGMGWSFLLDQITPLIIGLTAAILFLTKNSNFKTIKTKLKAHWFLLFLIFIIAFVTHLGILSYYFWSDEVIFMLEPITQNYQFVFHAIGGANMRGYFIASYAFLYLLFGTHAWVYPLFSVTYFAISVLFVYWFIYLLTNKRFVAVLASVFFATTPAYLDMFTWHSTAHAPILILGLASFISLLYYKKNNKFVYYIFSIIFFFASIKLGFVRSAGFTFIPLFLLLLPFYKQNPLKPLQLVSYTLPYIAIALYFVLFEFLYLDFVAAGTLFKDKGITDAINSLLAYRGPDAGISNFWPKLFFFTPYLFIPSGAVFDMLPLFKTLFRNVSLTISLGYLSISVLLFLLLIAIRFKHKKGWQLVIFAILFIFLNMFHSIFGYESPNYFNLTYPTSSDLLDKRFSHESLGYGPGSRYMFISSVGVSLLFALFITWIASKKKVFSFLAFILCASILGINTYYTVRAQITNVKSIEGYKSLVEHIFSNVPRDGKPKLLFSSNPEINGLDTKFGHWMWLYGFYKTNELVYTKDQEKLEELITNKQYSRENLYAFYNNPQTLTFRDISKETRDYLFNNISEKPNSSFLNFQTKIKKSTISTLSESPINLMERAVIESEDLNKRIIGTKNLKFKLNTRKILNPPLPLTDTLLVSLDKKYSYNFPLDLWDLLKPSPNIIKNTADLIQDSKKLITGKQGQILNILQKRNDVARSMNIQVSNMKQDDSITKESLLDGYFTNYPKPDRNERFFVAQKNPVVLTLSFSKPTAVRRILLNTPSAYTPANSPKKISLFYLNNLGFEKIMATEKASPDIWSPNRGKMYRLDLPKTIITKSLQIEISSVNDPVALDEIVIDGPQALDFSPEDIYQTGRNAFANVENRQLLGQLEGMNLYNHIFLLWACAEDSDWDKQQNSQKDLVNGIWNTTVVNMPIQRNEVDDSVEINCYGSKLRKVFFISPPYPVEMEVIEAVIE